MDTFDVEFTGLSEGDQVRVLERLRGMALVDGHLTEEEGEGPRLHFNASSYAIAYSRAREVIAAACDGTDINPDAIKVKGGCWPLSPRRRSET